MITQIDECALELYLKYGIMGTFMKRHLLIVGGMGPQASVYAHKRVLDIAYSGGAHNNEDYPRITHLSINVPDFITDKRRKAEALENIMQALSEVDTHSVTSGFIACNTAHMLFDEVAERVGKDKMMSIIDATKSFANKKGLDSTKIGILATPSTLAAKLYSAGILPDEGQQKIIENCIRALISNESPEHVYPNLLPVLDDFLTRGATHIVLGCTELSMLGGFLTKYPLIDPVDITISRLME